MLTLLGKQMKTKGLHSFVFIKFTCNSMQDKMNKFENNVLYVMKYVIGLMF